MPASWIELYTQGDNAVAALARKARDQAVAARDITVQKAIDTTADAVQTGLDRIATGQDRTATGQDRTATGQDRVQTGLDRTATGISAGAASTSETNALAAKTATAADRVQTGQDRIATGQDRVQTGLDRTATGISAGAASTSETNALASKVSVDASAIATAADRVQTGQDRIAASTSATAAAASVPVAADRTVGRRLNDTSIWPPLRSTKTWDVGPDGSIAEIAPDTIAWGFDPATLAPRGMQFQGARTNGATNSRGEGAVVGTPGTLPTGWFWAGPLPSGVTYAVTELGTSNGISYIRLQLSGTAAASTTARLHFKGGTGSLAAVAGDTVASAVYVGLPPGGSLPTGFGTIAIASRGLAADGSTNLETAGVGPNITSTLITGALSGQRTRSVGTLVNASTAFAVPYLSVGISNGATVLADFLIGFPSIEKGPFASMVALAPIGAPALFARAQNTVDIPVAQLGTRWNRRQGIIMVDWASQPGAFTSAVDADWFGLFSWGDRTANERMGLLVNPAHTSVEARITAGGVVQAAASRAMTAPTAGQTIRSAISWDLDFTSPGVGKMQVASRGAAGTAVAITALPIPGWIMPGRFGTSHSLYGWIGGFEVRPAALFDATLAALT